MNTTAMCFNMGIKLQTRETFAVKVLCLCCFIIWWSLTNVLRPIYIKWKQNFLWCLSFTLWAVLLVPWSFSVSLPFSLGVNKPLELLTDERYSPSPVCDVSIPPKKTAGSMWRCWWPSRACIRWVPLSSVTSTSWPRWLITTRCHLKHVNKQWVLLPSVRLLSCLEWRTTTGFHPKHINKTVRWLHLEI